MSEIELLKCPYCGHHAVRDETDPGPADVYFVRCSQVFDKFDYHPVKRVYGRTREEADENWNEYVSAYEQAKLYNNIWDERMEF